jgi:hypothetical protein
MDIEFAGLYLHNGFQINGKNRHANLDKALKITVI